MPALAKLLTPLLLVIFSACAGSPNFRFTPVTGQTLSSEKVKSYEHFRLAKKSDTAAQVRYIFTGAVVAYERPLIAAESLSPRNCISFADFVLNLLTSDIPPPSAVG